MTGGLVIHPGTEGVPGRLGAGRHYMRAVARLEDAASRDWVFDPERRERDLGGW
ncbi:MAG: hypothetical protein GQ558_02190 [Thermoplasmata archaeon]|nr:hypothetical protein [Thermoplasmata archaeon]